MRRPYVVVLLALAACSHGKAPAFNPLPSGAATAPATAPSGPATGSSTLAIGGEVTMTSSRDMQCSYAVDDFFVRGRLDDYQGLPMYVSINVEFFKKPGRYAGKTQVLIRRVAQASTFYASWAESHASATVLARGQGLDLDLTTVPPEAGTDATKPITVSGHIGCLPQP
jgi:hypothetical protein